MNSRNFLGKLSLEIDGDILLGGIPASKQPSARAIMSSPTSFGEAKPAVTPVERTTKSRSSSMFIRERLTDSSIVSLTNSETDSLVSSTCQTVSPKTFSPFFGGLISRVILTVLSNRYVLLVLRLVAVRMYLVVVFPSSTDATM